MSLSPWAREARRIPRLTRRRAILRSDLPVVPMRSRGRLEPGEKSLGPLDLRAAGIGPDGRVLSVWSPPGHPSGHVLVVRPDASPVWRRTDLDVHFVQPLPDGRVLLVARDTRGEPNAEVLDAEGRLVRQAFVGDAVRHVIAASSGDVWIGYSESFSDRFAERMLVRFDADLHLTWSLPPVPELRSLICLHALNVVGPSAVAAGYGEFVPFGVDGDVVHPWTSRAPDGVQGLLRQDDHVLAFGGWEERFDLLLPLRPAADGPESDPVARVVLPDARELPRGRLTTRGPDLHLVTREGWWCQLSLADIAATKGQ